MLSHQIDFPVIATDDVCFTLLILLAILAMERFSYDNHCQSTLGNNFKLQEAIVAHQFCWLFHSHNTVDSSLAAYETCKHKSYDSS